MFFSFVNKTLMLKLLHLEQDIVLNLERALFPLKLRLKGTGSLTGCLTRLFTAAAKAWDQNSDKVNRTLSSAKHQKSNSDAIKTDSLNILATQQILSIKVMNRISDKRKPWQSSALTRNEFDFQINKQAVGPIKCLNSCKVRSRK